ncbi:uncharacterized protein [Typha latifolia]|uniref:uncharacterized protein n=1 Tax=Typha latifolia TaxID=4733 RepID=UPI003C2C6747
MAEFPPNLDDGELWLPSAIFADVGVCLRHHHNHLRRHEVTAGHPPPSRPPHYEGFRPGWSRFGPESHGVRPVFFFAPVKPDQTKGLGRQQFPGQFRFVPVRSGLGRECGGTGVFLPRVMVNNQVKKKPNDFKGFEQRKQQQQQRQPKKGMQFQPPELSLPQEWTY